MTALTKIKRKVRSWLEPRKPKFTDFAPESLPWIDRDNVNIDRHIANSTAAKLFAYDAGEKLRHWREFGFVILPSAIDESLIDQYVRDLEDLITNHKNSKLEVDIWLPEYRHQRVQKVADLSPEVLRGPCLKFLFAHWEIDSAKALISHPSIMQFLELVFGEPATPMQSLTFRYGSEQNIHQDYAYVVPSIPSHMAASWIALEDIHSDAGPLFYFEKSHKIPIFNFGNGSFLDKTSTRTHDEFIEYISDACRQMGLNKKELLIKKGDVLLWHAALAHGGEARANKSMTRQSLVTHYTSRTAAQHPGLLSG